MRVEKKRKSVISICTIATMFSVLIPSIHPQCHHSGPGGRPPGMCRALRRPRAVGGHRWRWLEGCAPVPLCPGGLSLRSGPPGQPLSSSSSPPTPNTSRTTTMVLADRKGLNPSKCSEAYSPPMVTDWMGYVPCVRVGKLLQ